ncbi:MAG TPA: hypothetical protein DCY84_10655 [Firmicutes bacterium]|jgi:phenylpyruvate tautomerase PptA (4-oxalocrotonate tautomerase family)|nr:hypothetical protein [Bacillota bacterium]HBG43273.1 hypothetical protein [Bacillota bacterium]HBL67295.1 hypothetical protein [Bacillota bacterium]HBR25394.1 hypothetical protein [Bacillota bacterium]HCF88634.1 hypothetical protein [Bacillota bacterium]
MSHIVRGDTVMPQVIIHLGTSIDNDGKDRLAKSIRELIPSVLGIDEKIGQVLLYESSHRATHTTRDANFVFVQVNMYTGRSLELKAKLAAAIIAEIHKYTMVDCNDINLGFYELTPDNYFGGISHKYIEELRSK